MREAGQRSRTLIWQPVLPDWLPLDVIDDSNNGSVNWRVFAAECHSCGTSLNDEDLFAIAGIHRIDGNDVPLFVVAFRIYQLADKEFLPLEARVLARGDNSAGNASEKHDLELLRALSNRQNVFEV